MANPNQPHKADGSFAKTTGSNDTGSKSTQSTGKLSGKSQSFEDDNFANDPEKARIEGSKGGKASHR